MVDYGLLSLIMTHIGGIIDYGWPSFTMVDFGFP